MMKTLLAILLLLATIKQAHADCVVLLHGLARTSSSMELLGASLEKAGYRVVNVDYESRNNTIEAIAPKAVRQGVQKCNVAESEQLHFVTHSLGGILVRYYLAQYAIPQLGRVVMLAPPNQGSEVVDNWKNVPGYKLLNGPAGMQLGTNKDSVPLALGPVHFPLGVIAGNKTFNPILSLSLPNPDDGKVSVANTKVKGMTDFIELPHTHTFIMRAERAIEQAKYFLEHGSFNHSESSD